MANFVKLIAFFITFELQIIQFVLRVEIAIQVFLQIT